MLEKVFMYLFKIETKKQKTIVFVFLSSDDNECIHPELNTCNPVTEMCINKNGTFDCECKLEYLNGTVCSSGMFPN